MEIIVQQIEQRILIASEGHEIYNIADPTIYGKRITLAKSDTPDNWAERPETIIELNPVPENSVTEPVEVVEAQNS